MDQTNQVKIESTEFEHELLTQYSIESTQFDNSDNIQHILPHVIFSCFFPIFFVYILSIQSYINK